MKTFVEFLHESKITSENNLFSYTDSTLNQDGSTTYKNVVTKFPIGSQDFGTFIPANSMLYSMTIYPSGSASIVTNPEYPEIIVTTAQMAKSAIQYDCSIYKIWETQTVEFVNKLKTLNKDTILALRSETESDSAIASVIHKALFDTVLDGEI